MIRFKPLGHLTQKERVAELMSLDLDAHQIAERLNLHVNTVHARVAEIRRDLGVPAYD